MADNLYRSECLENLDGTDDINNPNLTQFKYDDILLYNIAIDPIEACAINNDTKIQELLDILNERSKKYDASLTQDTVLGALKAKMESYDCNVVYTEPWNGNDDGDLDQIWLNFIHKQMECDGIITTFVPTDADDALGANPAGYEDKPEDDNQYEHDLSCRYCNWSIFWFIVGLYIIIAL